MTPPTDIAAAPAPAADSSAEPGFGVYVHWPFCAQKCPYCDFNSHVRHGGIDEARFQRAFLAEIDATRTLIGPRTTRSIHVDAAYFRWVMDEVDHAEVLLEEMGLPNSGVQAAAVPVGTVAD